MNYLTRVELHNATGDDYESLHVHMEREGFSRTIKGANGYTYHLPPAEYYRTTNLDIEAVRDSAKRAANCVKTANAVVVAQTTSVAWSGLQTVQYAS